MELRSTNNNSNTLLRSIDWLTLILYLIMVVAGAVSVYAASYDFDGASMFAFSE